MINEQGLQDVILLPYANYASVTPALDTLWKSDTCMRWCTQFSACCGGFMLQNESSITRIGRESQRLRSLPVKFSLATKGQKTLASGDASAVRS